MTIPDHFLRDLGLGPNSVVVITIEHGELRIAPTQWTAAKENSLWLLDLYNYYAPVREDFLARGLTEDQINAEIDAAIKEVRWAERQRCRRFCHERLDPSDLTLPTS
jgi:hypothetical protein